MGKIAFQICILMLCIATSGWSQEVIYHETVPEINGHKFVHLPVVPGPHINTSFTSRLGVESTIDLTIPPLEILPDSIKGLEGSLVFATLAFEYQQKVKDWLAFYMHIGIAVRSGTELRSLLFEGVSTLIGGETGVLFHLSKGPKHKLSGHVSVNNYQSTIINLNQFAEDLINDVPNPSISYTAPALSVGTGVRYATAFSTVTGLTVYGDVQYGESISRGSEQLRYRFGTSVDFNWVDKGVPIAVALGYAARSSIDYVYVDKKIAHTLGANIAYTAAPDFILGVGVTYSKVPTISLADPVSTLGATINLTYFFN